MAKPAKNTICLWYDADAEEAARFYAQTFRPNNRHERSVQENLDESQAWPELGATRFVGNLSQSQLPI